MLPTGEPASALQIRAINYVLVQVNDLRKAEQFYQDFSRCGSWAACDAVPTGRWCHCRVITPGIERSRQASWRKYLLPLERTIDPRRAAGRAWRSPGSGCAGDRVAGRRFAHLRHDQGRGLDAAADGFTLRNRIIHLPGSVQRQLGNRGRWLRAADSGLGTHKAIRTTMLDAYRDLIDDLLSTPTEIRALIDASGGSNTSPEAMRLVAEFRNRDRAILEGSRPSRARRRRTCRHCAPAHPRTTKICPRSWKRWKSRAGTSSPC